jgi:hypothetical protein
MKQAQKLSRDTQRPSGKRTVVIPGVWRPRSRPGPFVNAFLALVLAGTASLIGSGPAVADTHSGYLVDRGLAVYYAVIPAEMVRGHSKSRPEGAMHGGVTKRPHAHHVMVALFVAKSPDRIVDNDVTATVGEVGLAGERRELEPFIVADALTYGNYFDLRPNTHYRIRVYVQRPDTEEAARLEVESR